MLLSALILKLQRLSSLSTTLSPLQQCGDLNFSSLISFPNNLSGNLSALPVTIFHLKGHPCHQNQTALGSNTTTRPRTELKFTDNLKARTLSFIWLQFHPRPSLFLLMMACKQHHAKLGLYYPNKLNSFP